MKARISGNCETQDSRARDLLPSLKQDLDFHISCNLTANTYVRPISVAPPNTARLAPIPSPYLDGDSGGLFNNADVRMDGWWRRGVVDVGDEATATVEYMI